MNSPSQLETEADAEHSYISSGWRDSLNWMAQLGKKVKRRMGRVKGASGDLAQRRSLGCWEELVDAECCC